MTTPVRLRPEALAEFNEAVDWYEERAGLGADFIAQVREALGRIAANPQLHAPIYRDIRKAPSRSSPTW